MLKEKAHWLKYSPPSSEKPCNGIMFSITGNRLPESALYDFSGAILPAENAQAPHPIGDSSPVSRKDED